MTQRVGATPEVFGRVGFWFFYSVGTQPPEADMQAKQMEIADVRIAFRTGVRSKNGT